MSIGSILNRFAWVFWGVLAGCLGYAANLLKLELFFQVDFLFGTILVWLALFNFGYRAGILAAIIAATSTYAIWNHPWAMVIFALEGIFVASLCAKKRILVFSADIIFWIVAGIPLVWIFYHFVMGVQLSATTLISLKQPINGIVNALIASFFHYIFSTKRSNHNSQEFSYQRAIFLTLAVFIIVPALIGITHFSRRYRESEELKLAQLAQQWSELESNQIDHLLRHYKQRAEAIALEFQNFSREPQSSLQTRLEEIHRVSPDFRRLGIFPPNAFAVAFSPAKNESGDSNLGLNLSDRYYVPNLPNLTEPFYSEMMNAKIEPHDPIVAIVTPIRKNNAFAGFGTAVLDLNKLASTLHHSHATQGVTHTLLDNRNQVVFTTDRKVPIQKTFTRIPGSLKSTAVKGVKHWVPELEPGVSVMQRWRDSTYVSEHELTGAAGWKLVTEVSVLPLIISLSNNTIQLLGSIGVLLFVVFGITHNTSWHFVKTIKELENKTREIPSRVKEGGTCVLPQSRFVELQSLIANFDNMIASLREAFVSQRKLLQDESKHLREKELLVRDLHDGIGGIVTNIGMLGEYALNVSDSTAQNNTIRKIISLAREGNTEVRSFMNSLSADNAAWHDLLAEIKNHAESMLDAHNVKVSATWNIHPQAPLPGIYRYGNIVRIARETITNVLKHANASEFSISFVVNENTLEIVFSDNGAGFNSQNIRKRGLANMFSRAQHIGADLLINAQHGTQIRLFMQLSSNTTSA